MMRAARTARPEGQIMDMHPPPAQMQVQMQVYGQQAQSAPSQPLQIAPTEDQLQAPVEPVSIKVKVSDYIPPAATSATLIVTLTPPTGQALIFTEGSENYGTVFKGGRSVGDIRLDGPYIYVKLYGATSFDIQYINYRVP
jgi:hypothetical protein